MLYELKKPLVVDQSNSNRITKLISKDLGIINQGLYVFLFENKSEHNIWDSNKKPKIVVYNENAAIKPGKFEQDFQGRFYGYEKAMRFDLVPQLTNTAFLESFVCGYLLDLSKNTFRLPSARIFEKYWIEEINAFLSAEKILASHQNNQAEWRNIQSNCFTPLFLEKLHRHLSEVSNKISLMQKVISDN